jgi:hypothetical protein
MNLSKASLWAVATVLAAALSIVAAPAEAARWTLPATICTEQVIDFGTPEIVTGCELVDCCPGCPGPPEWLSWRVRLSGTAVPSMLVQFENLTPEIVKGIGIEGNARWVGDGLLEVGSGETWLTGLPADIKGRPPVARAWMPKGDVPKGGRARADFAVDIFHKEFPVNEYAASYTIVDCPPPQGPPRPGEDQVVLSSNDGGDNAVVLLDGRRDGIPPFCVDDEVQRGTGTIGLGNFLHNATCGGDEIVVFSDDDAMRLFTFPTWTDPVGDVRGLSLNGLLAPKVAIWLVRPPENGLPDALVQAATDSARAIQLYNSMNCGLRPQTSLTDARTDPDAAGLIDADCGLAADLRADIGFTEGTPGDTLNVYYVRNPGARGWFCGNNTLIVGAGADAESLSHELGHAFSLDHTNLNAAIPSTNLMITGGTFRDSITEGQCFRANANTTSFINTAGLRAGQPTRSCPDGTTSLRCPALSLDVLPN